MTLDPAEINRSTWDTDEATAELHLDGWSDPGEPAAMTAFADAVRGRRVLEIGVGTGRLVPLLRLVTPDYAGVDFAEAPLARARATHPEVDLRHDDARTLDTVADGSVDGVVFGFNGIDAVSPDDRQRVLTAVHRVLTPGGWFLYSTLNLEGPAYDQRPWRQRPLPWAVGSLRPTAGSRLRWLAFVVLRLARDPGRPRRVQANWRRLQPGVRTGDGWAVGISDAHEFGLLVHFATVAHEVERLRTAGLEVRATFGAEDGRPADGRPPGDQPRWFHVLARRVS